jgi:hypothetical protein
MKIQYINFLRKYIPNQKFTKIGQQ